MEYLSVMICGDCGSLQMELGAKERVYFRCMSAQPRGRVIDRPHSRMYAERDKQYILTPNICPKIAQIPEGGWDESLPASVYPERKVDGAEAPGEKNALIRRISRAGDRRGDKLRLYMERYGIDALKDADLKTLREFVREERIP